MEEITDAEKLAHAVAFVVNGYDIGQSAQVEGRWLLSKREKDVIMYWGVNGGWVDWKLLDFGNEDHQRSITHTLDDAFRAAKELPTWKDPFRDGH